MILYSVHCDGCGASIVRGEPSMPAARAEAPMKHGSNKEPSGDRRLSCRQAEIKRQMEEMLVGGTPPFHST